MNPSGTVQQLSLAGLHAPQILTLAITGACNLVCSHCWVAAGEAASPGHVPLPILHHLIADFAALGGSGIRITGGEPLCHPQLLDILSLSCSYRFTTVALQTNAMLLGDEQCTALRHRDFPGLSIQISLDGATAATHDLVRGEGAFHGALQGIMRLVQAGLGQRISLFFTEMRHNLSDIPELLTFADQLGIGSVTTGTMVQCGRASEATLLAPPEVSQYLSLLERYDRDARFRERYQKIGTVAALEWHKGDANRHECCTLIENPYLTPAGRLYPCLLCHTDDYSVTGVFEKGLTAALAEGVPLWSSLLHVSRHRRDKIAECRDCAGKSRCGGGCMGRAWGSSTDLLAADDRCAVRREIYRQR
jgi:radical SAM protein with 4Fe4S-binding SPASM domain